MEGRSGEVEGRSGEVERWRGGEVEGRVIKGRTELFLTHRKQMVRG